MPVEVGDATLRAGLAEIRELVGPLPARAHELERVIGRILASEPSSGCSAQVARQAPIASPAASRPPCRRARARATTLRRRAVQPPSRSAARDGTRELEEIARRST